MFSVKLLTFTDYDGAATKTEAAYTTLVDVLKMRFV
jgi:hypothetical protein